MDGSGCLPARHKRTPQYSIDRVEDGQVGKAAIFPAKYS
jgi:hypothetical protein